MTQTLFPRGDCIFQNDNAPIYTAHMVQNWYEKHLSELKHMEWPPPFLGINNIEHLWCVLERQVRNCYPSLSTLKELEKVLIKEWLKIPVDKVRKLYDSIPRHTAAVCKAKKDPTPK